MLAALVSIMQETGIRIGNATYEKMNGSFGLSTLKDKHVRIKGNEVRFAFRGKKGVSQNLSLKSRRLAGIVRKCRDIPGAELFQYIADDGSHKAIDSGRLNSYIKDISGGHFTAKDFRTWTGTLTALRAFREIGCAHSSKTERTKGVNSALDKVAAHLGNHPHRLPEVLCASRDTGPLRMQQARAIPESARRRAGGERRWPDERRRSTDEDSGERMMIVGQGRISKSHHIQFHPNPTPQIPPSRAYRRSTACCGMRRSGRMQSFSFYASQCRRRLSR